jgi:hypothetical protein
MKEGMNIMPIEGTPPAGSFLKCCLVTDFGSHATSAQVHFLVQLEQHDGHKNFELYV